MSLSQRWTRYIKSSCLNCYCTFVFLLYKQSFTKLRLRVEDLETRARPMWRLISIFPNGKGLIKTFTGQHFLNDDYGSRGVTSLFLCVPGWFPLFFNKTGSQGDITFILSRPNADSRFMNIRQCSKGSEHQRDLVGTVWLLGVWCLNWMKYGFGITCPSKETRCQD